MSEQTFNIVTGLLATVVVPFCWVAIWKWSKRGRTDAHIGYENGCFCHRCCLKDNQVEE